MGTRSPPMEINQLKLLVPVFSLHETEFLRSVCLFFQPPGNIQYAALVIGGSFLIEGTSHGIIVLHFWSF